MELEQLVLRFEPKPGDWMVNLPALLFCTIESRNNLTLTIFACESYSGFQKQKKLWVAALGLPMSNATRVGAPHSLGNNQHRRMDCCPALFSTSSSPWPQPQDKAHQCHSHWHTMSCLAKVFTPTVRVHIAGKLVYSGQRMQHNGPGEASLF